MSTLFEVKGRKYQQVQSLRDITNTNFANGQIRFNWSIPAQESWNPYLSFFTMRYNMSQWRKKTNPVDNAGRLVDIDPGSGVAPTMFFNDSLWQQMEIQINGITINKHDNYCHQIAALKYRLQTETMNKQMYKMNFTDIDIKDRANKFGPGGYGDNLSESTSRDLFDVIESGVTVQSNNVAAGGACTITFVGASRLSDLFKVGDIIHVNFNSANNPYTEGPITAVTASTVVFTSVAAGQLNGGGAAALLANQILFGGAVRKAKDSAPKYRYIETIWKPKLDFFDVNAWLPGGEYEIILTPYPDASLRRQAMEVDFDSYANWFLESGLSIVSMELNVCTSAQPGDAKSITFNEIRCQAKTINTSSLSQKQFNIHPGCKTIVIAYQDHRVNSDYRISSSKFKIIANIDDPVNRNVSWEQNLSRFFIQYDGDVLPTPIPDIRKDADQDYFYQRYWETQQYKIMQYDDIETYEEWKARGPYFLFCWPRKNKNAFEIQVSQEFQGLLPNGLAPQLLLFEIYIQKYDFTLSNGYITAVKKMI